MSATNSILRWLSRYNFPIGKAEKTDTYEFYNGFIPFTIFEFFS